MATIKEMIEKKDVNGIMKAYTNKKGPDVEQAANGLVALGEPAVQPLIDLFWRKSNGWERMAIASLIARIGEPALDKILPLLSDPKKRRISILVLVFMPGLAEVPTAYERTIDPLLAAYQAENDATIRPFALRAIGNCLEKTQDPGRRARAFNCLVEALRDSSEDMRSAAVSGLAKSGEASARQHLESALRDRSSAVREEAKKALDELKKNAGSAERSGQPVAPAGTAGEAPAASEPEPDEELVLAEPDQSAWDIPAEQTVECPYCKHMNPAGQEKCEKCGYSNPTIRELREKGEKHSNRLKGVGYVVIGVVLALAGWGLSSVTDTLFYGAICVGAFFIIVGLVTAATGVDWMTKRIREK